MKYKSLDSLSAAQASNVFRLYPWEWYSEPGTLTTHAVSFVLSAAFTLNLRSCAPVAPVPQEPQVISSRSVCDAVDDDAVGDGHIIQHAQMEPHSRLWSAAGAGDAWITPAVHHRRM